MRLNLSKKRILTIVTIVLLIINILVASLIVIDIQVISVPKTEIFIDLAEINSEEIMLDAKIKMDNTNSFDIEINDITVTSLNYENEEIGKLIIKDEKIPASKTKTFSETERIVVKESDNISFIKNIVKGKISVTFLGFIKKSIPIDITIYTTVDKIFENLKIPEIGIKAGLDDITNEGVLFSTEVSINNPSSFVYNIDNLIIDIINDEGAKVANIYINGGPVEPQKSRVFYSSSIIDFDVLNEGTLTIKLKGIAGAKVAGINKNISFSTDASLIIPDIKEFVFKDENIDFRIPVQFKLTLRGLLSNVAFNFYNPSNASLTVDNLKCSIYRVDGEKQSLLGEKNMNICEAPPGERVCIKTQILIPYLKFLSSGSFRLIPDWIILRFEGDFHIAGTSQSLPLALNAYVDLNIINPGEFDGE